MTKEQEEAIKEIKTYIHDYTMEAFDDDGYTRYEISEEEQNFFNNIDKLLNLLKEKDTEIEKLKRDFKIVDEECSRLERKEAKQDKMIDLFIDELVTNMFDRCCQECCRECEKDRDTLRSCIKQYFERKVEDECKR